MKLRIDHLVVPYYRQTQRSKYRDPAARRYNESQEALGDKILLELRSQGLPDPLYPKPARLRMNVTVARRQRISVIDASNLLKAVEDAANGILWDDDRQVYVIWMTKLKDTSDWVEITLEEIAW